MKRPLCPRCDLDKGSVRIPHRVVRAGYFRRTSDSRTIQRFRCLLCRKQFSWATFSPCFKQKKRNLNYKLFKELCSGVSQRRAARNLCLSRTTVVRKFIFLGLAAKNELEEWNLRFPPEKVVVFDDLETFEHTKCKPLSVTLAVSKSRRILGFEVSRMPAKGHLAKIALKKYGPRRDERKKGRQNLFQRIKPLVAPDALLKSDENPYYGPDVKSNFPNATHETFKGQRGSIVGQGELKKVRFDPLFCLNHTCAMLRANINRLIRKTWCTTKIPERLSLHIAMYAVYHNLCLPDDS